MPARRCCGAALAGARRWRSRSACATTAASTHRFAAPPQRIVSLLPSLTESVCALGACARLVGVDRFSNWPPSVRALPQARRARRRADRAHRRAQARRGARRRRRRASSTGSRRWACGSWCSTRAPMRDVQRRLDARGRLLGDAGARPRCGRDIEARLSAAAGARAAGAARRSASTSRSTPRLRRRRVVVHRRDAGAARHGQRRPGRARAVPEAEPRIRGARPARHRDGRRAQRRRRCRSARAGARCGRCSKAHACAFPARALWSADAPRPAPGRGRGCSPTAWPALPARRAERRRCRQRSHRRAAARLALGAVRGDRAAVRRRPGGGQRGLVARAARRLRGPDAATHRRPDPRAAHARRLAHRRAARPGRRDGAGLFRNPLADPYLLGSAAGRVARVVLVLARRALAGHGIGLATADALARVGLVGAAFAGALGGVVADPAAGPRRAADDARCCWPASSSASCWRRSATWSRRSRPTRCAASRPSCSAAPASSAGQLRRAGRRPAARRCRWRGGWPRALDALTLGEDSARQPRACRCRACACCWSRRSRWPPASRCRRPGWSRSSAWCRRTSCAASRPRTRFTLLASAARAGRCCSAADVLARVLIAPQELPVGVLTAVLGGGYLLWLLHRTRAAGE